MKIAKYTLGAGPHVATRVEQPDAIEIRMFDGAASSVSGHGHNARAAAAHLAEQLRTLAYLVEAHEGVRSGAVAPGAVTNNQGLVVTLPADLVRSIDAYLDTDWKSHDSIAPLNAVAFIGERVAAIRKANRRANR